MAVCDICGSAIYDNRTDIPSNVMKEFANAGFYPSRHSKAMAFAQGPVFGDSVILADPSGDRIEVDTTNDRDKAKVMWAMTVAVNTTDWALCADCLGEMADFERSAGLQRGIDRKWRSLPAAPTTQYSEYAEMRESGKIQTFFENIFAAVLIVGIVGANFYFFLR